MSVTMRSFGGSSNSSTVTPRLEVCIAEEVHEIDASSRRVTARERTFTYNISYINVTTAHHVSSNTEKVELCNGERKSFALQLSPFITP